MFQYAIRIQQDHFLSSAVTWEVSTALCFSIRLWETGATCCMLETPFFCKMSEFDRCILWAVVSSYFFRDSMSCKNCFQGSDNFMRFGGL